MEFRRLVIILMIATLFFFPPLSNGKTSINSVSINEVEEVSSPNTGQAVGEGLTQFDNTSQVDIDLIFMGFNDTIVDDSLILDNLLQWQAPIERLPTYYQENLVSLDQVKFDVNYTLNYNMVYASNQQASDYYSFIQNNGILGEVNYDWPLNIDPEFMRPYSENAYYIRPEVVEEYLNNEFASSSDFKLVIIDTFTGQEDTFIPYYFNNSFGDLDNPDFLDRRYSAMNQIAGGSSNSRLLFVDYSAGPNKYADNNGRGHPHITDYNYTIAEDLLFLNWNITLDILTAIEMKFLPSNIYTPIVPNRNVVYEILVLNFEDAVGISGFESIPISNLDYYSQFNELIFRTELRKVNPVVNWTVEYLGEWDWMSDPNMVQNVSNAIDIQNEYIDDNPILDYLDTVYQSLFSSSNDTHIIVPVFFWGLPGAFGTGFGGVAYSDNLGQFSYFVSAESHDYLLGVEYSVEWGSPDNIINQNQGESEYVGYLEGYYQGDIMETTITVYSGDNITVELLDGANYQKSLDGNSYNTIASFTNMNSGGGTYAFNTSGTDIYNAFWWKMTNTGTVLATYDVSRIRYSWISSGYTRVSIHEAGHGVGISHPHDAFSWGLFNITDGVIYDYGDYVEWLWDSSYTTMSYAQATPGFSILDIDSVQRGFIPDFLTEIYHRSLDIHDTLSGFTVIPSDLYGTFSEIKSLYDQSVTNFHDMNYVDAVISLTSLFSKLDYLEQEMVNSINELSLEILNYNNYEDLTVSYIIVYGQQTKSGEYTGSEIVIQEVPWENLEITIDVDGVPFIHYIGYTWDGSVILTLPSQENTNPSESNPQSNNGNDNASNGFLPIHSFSLAFALITMVIMTKLMLNIRSDRVIL